MVFSAPRSVANHYFDVLLFLRDFRCILTKFVLTQEQLETRSEYGDHSVSATPYTTTSEMLTFSDLSPEAL